MRTLISTTVVAGLALAAIAAAGLSCASAPSMAPPAPWDQMDHEQKVAHMKHVVLPEMKLEFQAFDAEEFAEMDCATCHGAGARDETFEMPNPDLPKLPGGKDGFEQLMRDEPQAAEFMAKVVVPKMAAMLGEKPYDPKEHKGFGCFNCHTTEGK